MGFTKPTKPIFPCDWQQLAGRSSSAGGGEVDLWVWCAVCVCGADSLAILCSGEFHSLPSCVCSCAMTPNPLRNVGLHGQQPSISAHSSMQPQLQCFPTDTHTDTVHTHAPSISNTYSTHACYCVRCFDKPY